MSSLAVSQRQARKHLAAADTSPSPGSGGRAVSSLIFLFIAAAAATGFMIAAQLVSADELRLEILGDWLRDDTMRQVSFAAGSLGVGILALALALRRPSLQQADEAKRHVVAMDDKGVVFVSSHSVSALATAAVRQAGALDAEVRVKGVGAGPVRLQVRAVVMPGKALPEFGRAAQDAARDAATRLAGLEVQDVNVELVVAAPENMERILR